MPGQEKNGDVKNYALAGIMAIVIGYSAWSGNMIVQLTADVSEIKAIVSTMENK